MTDKSVDTSQLCLAEGQRCATGGTRNSRHKHKERDTVDQGTALKKAQKQKQLRTKEDADEDSDEDQDGQCDVRVGHTTCTAQDEGAAQEEEEGGHLCMPVSSGKSV